MEHQQYTAEEIARRAKDQYEQHIRPHLGETSRGQYLMIDIESGSYELGEDLSTLSSRLCEKHQDAVLYAMRIGFPATGRIGKSGSES